MNRTSLFIYFLNLFHSPTHQPNRIPQLKLMRLLCKSNQITDTKVTRGSSERFDIVSVGGGDAAEGDEAAGGFATGYEALRVNETFTRWAGGGRGREELGAGNGVGDVEDAPDALEALDIGATIAI
jgi:hypothetical protein